MISGNYNKGSFFTSYISLIVLTSIDIIKKFGHITTWILNEIDFVIKTFSLHISKLTSEIFSFNRICY